MGALTESLLDFLCGDLPGQAPERVRRLAATGFIDCLGAGPDAVDGECAVTPRTRASPPSEGRVPSLPGFSAVARELFERLERLEELTGVEDLPELPVFGEQ